MGMVRSMKGLQILSLLEIRVVARMENAMASLDMESPRFALQIGRGASLVPSPGRCPGRDYL